MLFVETESLVLLLHGVEPTTWSYRLQDERHTLGRAPTCDIRLPYLSVSRRHAEICKENGGYCLRDLGSVNGTFLNGSRITHGPVTAGDALHVANVPLHVVDGSKLHTVAEMEFFTPPPERRPANLAEQLPLPYANGLSPSELRVLRFLLQGLSEKEIAIQLHLSSHTIHTHVKKIYRQLKVHSRGELMSRLLGITES